MPNLKSDSIKLFDLVFDQLSGLNYTYRFSGVLKRKEQTVAEHSFWTALIAGSLYKYEVEQRSLYKDKKIDFPLGLVYESCLVHDSEECVTGDINHNFKYYAYEMDNQIKNKLEEATEKIMNEKVFSRILVGEGFWVSWKAGHEKGSLNYLIKMADWIQLLQYALEEIKAGNETFVPIKNKVLKMISDKNDLAKKEKLLIYVPELIEDFLVMCVRLK